VISLEIILRNLIAVTAPNYILVRLFNARKIKVFIKIKDSNFTNNSEKFMN
jgi:hypothetical protein